jgi:hypothetical protein
MVESNMSQTAEKRRHHRFDIAYPAKLYSKGGKLLAESLTVNVSRRGAMMAIPVEAVNDLDDQLNVTISLPQSAFEASSIVSFAGEARVIRTSAISDDTHSVAVEFTSPISLRC